MTEEKFKLKRTKQCPKCPWKVGVDPHLDIKGYNPTKHQGLAKTIFPKGSTDFFPKESHVMSCHHSTPENEEYCVGWLHNQLGVGNNISLRLKMLNCENAGEIEVYGEQHKDFVDTLPEDIKHDL